MQGAVCARITYEASLLIWILMEQIGHDCRVLTVAPKNERVSSLKAHSGLFNQCFDAAKADKSNNRVSCAD